MQIVFVTIALIGLLYFFVVKRRFDFFGLAFLSSCIYFLPGFFGYALHPIRDGMPLEPTPLADEAYGVMCLVLAGVLMSGFLFTCAVGNRVTNREQKNDLSYYLTVLVTLAYTGLFLTLVTVGEDLFSIDKLHVLANLNRWHTLAMTAATVAAVLALAAGSKKTLLMTVPLFCLDMFIGFRAPTAMAAISAITYILGKQQASRVLINNIKLSVTGVSLAFFFFLSPAVYIALRTDVTHFAIFLSPDIYFERVVNSEPFVIQAILNEVISTGYSVPEKHLLDVFSAFIPFYTNLFDAPKSFNDYFQPALFPNYATYGMANNVWAEAIATGGFPLLVTYIMIYLIGLLFGTILLRSKNTFVAVGSAIVSSYWAFYIHRNDLAFQMNMERNFIIVMLLAVVLVAVFRSLIPLLKNAAFRERCRLK